MKFVSVGGQYRIAVEDISSFAPINQNTKVVLEVLEAEGKLLYYGLSNTQRTVIFLKSGMAVVTDLRTVKLIERIAKVYTTINN